MTTIQLERDLATEQLFEDWRFKAREALVRGIPPADIDFEDPYDTTTLRFDFSPATAAPPLPREPHPEPHVPATFLAAAMHVAAHSDPGRWNLLYRLLWRLQEDSSLFHFELDPDVRALRQMQAEMPPVAIDDLALLKKASRRVEYLVLRSEEFPRKSYNRRGSRQTYSGRR
jgi:DNA polymerase